MDISPLKEIPVSYTISYALDSETYYIQAVLRDTQSNAILQVLNLTKVGALRYSGIFGGVSDASGLGRAVDITITVYTDNAYSIPSANYQVVNIPYNVIQPYLPSLGTGGVSNDIDYKKIKRILKKEIDAETKKILARASKNTLPVKDIYQRLEELHEAILASSFKESSLSSIKEDLVLLSSSIKSADNKVSQWDKVFEKLEQINSAKDNSITAIKKLALENSKKDLNKTEEKFEEIISNFDRSIKKTITSLVETIKESIKKSVDEKPFSFTITPKEAKAQRSEIERMALNL